MTDLTISFGVFLAGLVSFLSPCVLPLVPPYLAYLGGTTHRAAVGGPDPTAHRPPGARAAGGRAVRAWFHDRVRLDGRRRLDDRPGRARYKDTLSTVAGVVMIAVRAAFSRRAAEFRCSMSRSATIADMQGVSLAGAYLIGLAFAFGWTPCVGPVLATVLAVAAQENSLKTGVWLLLRLFARPRGAVHPGGARHAPLPRFHAAVPAPSRQGREGDGCLPGRHRHLVPDRLAEHRSGSGCW